jgi:hypothetical protein
MGISDEGDPRINRGILVTNSETGGRMTKEFTSEIYRSNIDITSFKEPENWDEQIAKDENKLCCHDCRFFSGYIYRCSDYIGMYHKPCNEFKWW